MNDDAVQLWCVVNYNFLRSANATWSLVDHNYGAITTMDLNRVAS
jgi:hypothetical protein